MLNEQYATQTARDWNVKDSQSGAGYVTRFAEYWIPVEKLAEFNQDIVGLIEVVSEFRGNKNASRVAGGVLH